MPLHIARDRAEVAHEREPLIRVAAFFTEDLDALEPLERGPLGDVEALRLLIRPELSRSGFYGDRCVAAGGVVPLWSGVGCAWIWIDKRPGNVGALIRACRAALDQITKDGEFHRVEAAVRSDFPKGRRLLEALGFSHEGTLVAYGPDKSDHERYAFIRLK